MKCVRCNDEIIQNFCPNCGSPKQLTRIDGRYFTKEFGAIFNLDRGIANTIRLLLIRPGQSIRAFIELDRNLLVKPVVFLIICSVLYILAQRILRFEDAYVAVGGFGESSVTDIFVWIQSNYGYSNMLMSIFVAGWIKVFFRKYDTNFFEILILLCYTIGMGMLFYSVSGILESFTKWQILHIGGLVGLAYASWMIGQFFDPPKKYKYLKGLIAYLLGMISFFIISVSIGLTIDWLQLN